MQKLKEALSRVNEATTKVLKSKAFEVTLTDDGFDADFGTGTFKITGIKYKPDKNWQLVGDINQTANLAILQKVVEKLGDTVVDEFTRAQDRMKN